MSTSGKCPTAYVVKRKAWTAPVTNIDCSTRKAFRSLTGKFNLKKPLQADCASLNLEREKDEAAAALTYVYKHKNKHKLNRPLEKYHRSSFAIDEIRFLSFDTTCNDASRK